MKVAISIEVGNDLHAPVCPSFGRAPRFIVVDLEDLGETLLNNTAASGAHGAGTGAAALMAQAGVNAVISGRFGPKAFEALKAAGIDMYVSASEDSAGGVLSRFCSGILRKAEAV